MNDKDFKSKYIAARKKLITRDFCRLNQSQREAVLATEGPLLLLAGAGSGKTTVLIERIVNLLRYGRASDSTELPHGADDNKLRVIEQALIYPSPSLLEEARSYAALEPAEPWRVIAITFTNKAAGELKSRLESALGESSRDVWAMTFHSACVRILRSNIERAGFRPGFTIYDTSDSVSVMKRVLKELNLDEKVYPPRTVLAKISAGKDAGLSPEDYARERAGSLDPRDKEIAKAYTMYAKRLREANAMDFDDLILFTVRLLEENEDIRGYYRRKFRYVLVDEYQDTNILQYRLASLLTGENGNICVVGDDDQSIYKFRGATIENILCFEERYQNARVIRLEQNYRSTGNILAAANEVIKQNLGRKGKKLWTDAGLGEKLKLHVAANEREEARFVADGILASVLRGGSYKDNAVLYRMNALSNQIELALRAKGIPYRVIGGLRFFDRAEIKDMLAYLCVIQSPSDELRLRRIINNPVRGIGAATIEAVAEIAASTGGTMFGVMENADSYPQLSRSASKLRAFTGMINDLRLTSVKLPLTELYDELLEKTGYVRLLADKGADTDIARIENVEELRSNIAAFENETGGTLADFLDETALYTDIERLDAGSDVVNLLTIHSAKGLEFPNVYVIGAEEGVFPGRRSMGVADEMEEERRLCYVAITRAMRELTFICSRERMLFGMTTRNEPSRFLEDIPDEHIDRPDPARRGGGSTGEPRFVTNARPQKPSAARTRGAFSPPPGAKTLILRVGDKVTHTAFGDGTVKAVTPMGGDSLLEIEFSEGVKRLMLRAAVRYLQKTEGGE